MSVPWRNRLELYPAQREAIEDPPENAVIIAAPKAGKTIGALQWLIEETERVGAPYRRFLWVAPTFRQAQIAFRRSYLEVLDADQIQTHKTDYTITLPSECVIFFGSADKPENIYGEDYWGVVVDEATRTKIEAWLAVTSTIQHTAARVRLIGNNTRRPNWAKKLAIKARKGELPEWSYARLDPQAALDAGVVDAGQWERTKGWVPEDEWRILYGGEDIDDGTLRIDTYKLTEVPLPDLVLRARGWDLASTAGGDWTVGARMAASSEGFWIEDVVRERMGAAEVVDLICRTAAADGPSVEHIVEEEKGSSGKLFTETLRRALDQIPTAGPVCPAPVEDSKLVRAWPFVVEVGAGRYHLAPGFFNSEAMQELEEWPDSQYDDVVDALAHAHNHLAPLTQGLVGSGWVPGS